MLADTRQLTLDLPYVEAYGLAEFLPAENNRAALDCLAAWPKWPSTAVILCGPPGSGKTHLARSWAQRVDAAMFAPAQLWEEAQPLRRLGSGRTALVDDADGLNDDQALLHLYNVLQERRGGLLLTACDPAAKWQLVLPDLRSRLATSWVVEIGPPTDDLLAAVMIKQFRDRQLQVEPGVIDYLLSRMERSFAGARTLVDALDRGSLRAGRPIRLALARAVLHALTPDPPIARAAVVPAHGRDDPWISA